MCSLVTLQTQRCFSPGTCSQSSPRAFETR